MKKTINFATRVLDAIANVELRFQKDERGRYQVKNGRVLTIANRIKAYEGVCYEEKDLRGLSKAEKEFIRENDYRNYYDQREEDYKNGGYKVVRYYIFINRNISTGRPQIYAYCKLQWLDLGTEHFKVIGSDTRWNYQYWLLFDKNGYENRGKAFCRYEYEYRHTGFASVVNFNY